MHRDVSHRARDSGVSTPIHHSAGAMDWLAGSRLHLVDVAVTRGLTYVPLYVLGFAEAPLFAYLVFGQRRRPRSSTPTCDSVRPAGVAAGDATVPSLASRRGA